MLGRWRLLAAATFFIAVPTTAFAARGYATNTVHLRAGPGTAYPIVDTISGGAHVTIHGCLSDHAWCDVTWHRDRGWMKASYLNYFYNNRYVYLPDYIDTIDVPIVVFALNDYWGNYYVGRPWYHRRAHWARFWRSHHRHGDWRHRHARQWDRERVRGADHRRVTTIRHHRNVGAGFRTRDAMRHHNRSIGMNRRMLQGRMAAHNRTVRPDRGFRTGGHFGRAGIRPGISARRMGGGGHAMGRMHMGGGRAMGGGRMSGGIRSMGGGRVMGSGHSGMGGGHRH